MGSLFDQRERSAWKPNNYLTELRWELEAEMKDMNKHWTLEQKFKMLELMLLKEKNDMYEQNGDVHDEQMKGIGELFQRLIYVLDPDGKY